MFNAESDHADLVNMERRSTTIVDLLRKIKKRNNDLETRYKY